MELQSMDYKANWKITVSLTLSRQASSVEFVKFVLTISGLAFPGGNGFKDFRFGFLRKVMEIWVKVTFGQKFMNNLEKFAFYWCNLNWSAEKSKQQYKSSAGH